MNERPLSDYIQYKRDRAFEALDDIKKMLDNKMLSAAMNRVYYAGFYIVGALLLLDGFSTSKHRQLIGYFNKEYIKTGKVPVDVGEILDESYNRRVASDYHDFVYLTKTQVEEFFSQMKDFVGFIDRMIQDRFKE
ncbi:MAG: HEPN domain-containing protein [Ignavibacteriaceae bacterium]|nr:HEPN domain-containing protein [Ignavibacteriaceae bacterium]